MVGRALCAAVAILACVARAQWTTFTAYETHDSSCVGKPWHVTGGQQGTCEPSSCAVYRSMFGKFYAKTECLDEPRWPTDAGVVERLYRNDTCKGTPAEFRWYVEGCKYAYKAECETRDSVKLYDCYDDVGKCGTCDLVANEKHGKCVRDLSSLYATLTCVGYEDEGLSGGAVAAIVICAILGAVLVVALIGFSVWYIKKNKPHWIYQALPQ
eukprot:TRINITY_DN18855_c0_g1_i1.p1 TRINITY_DN18855_c0_g1~~TRINITY_DN18855_c0_g1_i1.p1  ORF type:complete len:212 (-),score=59.01 TRINITY_DN18855_c0_g1_i1:122-757(-)